MGLFNRKKKVIDLGERYRKRKAREEKINSGSTESSQESSQPATPFSFFDAGASSSSGSTSDSSTESSGVVDLSGTGTGTTSRKKRLAKRILDMTTKLEELSNQIYRLEQRVEVLERKSGRY